MTERYTSHLTTTETTSENFSSSSSIKTSYTSAVRRTLGGRPTLGRRPSTAISRPGSSASVNSILSFSSDSITITNSAKYYYNVENVEEKCVTCETECSDVAKTKNLKKMLTYSRSKIKDCEQPTNEITDKPHKKPKNKKKMVPEQGVSLEEFTKITTRRNINTQKLKPQETKSSSDETVIADEEDPPNTPKTKKRRSKQSTEISTKEDEVINYTGYLLRSRSVSPVAIETIESEEENIRKTTRTSKLKKSSKIVKDTVDVTQSLKPQTVKSSSEETATVDEEVSPRTTRTRKRRSISKTDIVAARVTKSSSEETVSDEVVSTLDNITDISATYFLRSRSVSPLAVDVSETSSTLSEQLNRKKLVHKRKANPDKFPEPKKAKEESIILSETHETEHTTGIYNNFISYFNRSSSSHESKSSTTITSNESTTTTTENGLGLIGSIVSYFTSVNTVEEGSTVEENHTVEEGNTVEEDHMVEEDNAVKEDRTEIDKYSLRSRSVQRTPSPQHSSHSRSWSPTRNKKSRSPSPTYPMLETDLVGETHYEDTIMHEEESVVNTTATSDLNDTAAETPGSSNRRSNVKVFKSTNISTSETVQLTTSNTDHIIVELVDKTRTTRSSNRLKKTSHVVVKNQEDTSNTDIIENTARRTRRSNRLQLIESSESSILSDDSKTESAVLCRGDIQDTLAVSPTVDTVVVDDELEKKDLDTTTAAVDATDSSNDTQIMVELEDKSKITRSSKRKKVLQVVLINHKNTSKDIIENTTRRSKRLLLTENTILSDDSKTVVVNDELEKNDLDNTIAGDANGSIEEHVLEEHVIEEHVINSSTSDSSQHDDTIDNIVIHNIIVSEINDNEKVNLQKRKRKTKTDDLPISKKSKEETSDENSVNKVETTSLFRNDVSCFSESATETSISKSNLDNTTDISATYFLRSRSVSPIATETKESEEKYIHKTTRTSKRKKSSKKVKDTVDFTQSLKPQTVKSSSEETATVDEQVSPKTTRTRKRSKIVKAAVAVTTTRSSRRLKPQVKSSSEEAVDESTTDTKNISKSNANITDEGTRYTLRNRHIDTSPAEQGYTNRPVPNNWSPTRKRVSSPKRKTSPSATATPSYPNNITVVSSISKTSSQRVESRTSSASELLDTSEDELRNLTASSDEETPIMPTKGILLNPGKSRPTRTRRVSFPDEAGPSNTQMVTSSTEQDSYNKLVSHNKQQSSSLKRAQPTPPHLMLGLQKYRSDSTDTTVRQTDTVTDRHTDSTTTTDDVYIRGYRDSSDEEFDEVDDTNDQAPSALKRMGTSVYHVTRNILLWIGLTCLTTNVYILSLFRKLYVWKDPFSDTEYNPDEETYSTPTTTRNATESRSIFRTITSYLPLTLDNREPDIAPDVTEPSKHLGWYGFLSALAFLGAILAFLPIIMVPSPVPATGTANSGPDMFNYLEEQKQFVSKVRELEAGLTSLGKNTKQLEAGLTSLGKNTKQSDDSIWLAIKGLEEEKEGLKQQLVAIATLDRQQSDSIYQLEGYYQLHSTQIQDMSGSLTQFNLQYDTLKTQLGSLNAVIAAISAAQEDLTSGLASSVQQHRTLSAALEEVAGHTAQTSRSHEKLQEGQEKLSARVLDTEKTGEELLSWSKRVENWVKAQLDHLQDKDPGAPDQTLLDKITQQDDLIAGHGQKLDALVAGQDGEKLEALVAEHGTRLDTVEGKINAVPETAPLPADLLDRVNTLTAELETLRASAPESEGFATAAQYAALEARVGELRDELHQHVAKSGGRFSEMLEQITLTNNQVSAGASVSQIKLQTIESKLAVMTALQERLDTIETQHTTLHSNTAEKDRATQEDIAKLVAELKVLDNKYQGKLSDMDSDLGKLNSATGDHIKTSSAAIQKHTEDISRLESELRADFSALQVKLQEYQDSTDQKIRNIVLEALASVTSSGQSTRFFSDWLQGTFLSREQFDREVKNDTTVVLPSQDHLIQVVIAELRSTHKIDLTAGSGITESDIRFIVSDALQTFNEDKTGRADFALEALGGTVISIGCTETYYEGAPYASFMSLPLYRVPNPPNVALQPDITPGKCWAFKGKQGYMMIKLAHAVHVDRFSMEHLPKKLSLYNDMSSAPRKFVVRGLLHPNDVSPHSFGEFSYSEAGPSLQHFDVQFTSKIAYEIVELDILSNQGNSEYTCLYRIRVHGQAPKLS